jgi:predicted DNA-binding transcriptional regulator YafY
MSYSRLRSWLMRADRLLQILLLLQTRGRMTAGDLARNLEVSVRTIQRDMDSLSAAGVPVFATRGGEGGWQLVDGFRTTLTGLTPQEALAVAVGRPDTVLRDLGIDSGSELGMLKVLASLPELARQSAAHASQRVHVDLEPWREQPEGARELLRTLYRAVATDAVAEIRYGTSRSALEVQPLGLVTKGLVWYLVAMRRRELRTYRVSRIAEVAVAGETFARPPDFDLVTHWRAVCEQVVDTFPSFVATLRTTEDGLRRLQWSGGRVVDVAETGRADDALRVRVDLENEDEAMRAVLALGADVVVERPRDLARRVVEEARALLDKQRAG